MQEVKGGSDIRVVVDYAHTPDALASALSALKQSCTGALWVVFGCGGDRDAGKRPEMGRIADSLADQLVVTNDNPRSESPEMIAEDILVGITGSPVMSNSIAAPLFGTRFQCAIRRHGSGCR